MSESESIDYGPLKELIGVWKGEKGIDIAPMPQGEKNTPYYETITFTAIGDVTNAKSQVLAAVHYRQIVQQKSDDSIFHDETGYWLWDKKAGVIMQSLTIPRGVSLLAGGQHEEKKEHGGTLVLEVYADLKNPDWQIIQSPFMKNNARTTAYSHRITVEQNKLSYSETTIVEIYGKTFEHSDQNELIRQ